MSVLCCRMPNFLTSLAVRRKPEWAGRPLVLLGADEQVWAVSPEARQSGVRLQMTPRQAQMRCPDALLQPLDVQQCEGEQHALLGTLAQSGLPVEEQTWGAAYVDLHALTGRDVPQERVDTLVQPLCADLGRQIRRLFDDALAPALGWDTGKFTARAAASCARTGGMRLIAHVIESRFLNPLPIHLLPLPPLSLQQLDWLGIRTLGQFARLPAAAVTQRFGQAGQIARQWAQGRDDRPVRSALQAMPGLPAIEFDPPAALHQAALAAALAALQPPLAAWAEQLAGCRRLRLDLGFAGGGTRTIDCAFVEPATNGGRLRATLAHRLQSLNWPAELSRMQIHLLERGELVAKQLTLFDTAAKPSPLVELAQKLAGRYGPLFFRAQITDRGHPLAERRAILQPLSATQRLPAAECKSAPWLVGQGAAGAL